MDAVGENVLSEDKSLNSKLQRNVDKNLLDIFWDLSKTKQPLRLHAAITIIRLLYDKQKNLSIEAQSREKSSDLEYTLKRLVRGLASSRQAARQGFCLALTEILRLFPVITIEDVIQHVEKDLSFHNKLEKCHTVIGRLMAFTAIVRSNRLKDDPYLSFVVINLYKLSVGKSYLQQAVYKLIIDLFSQLDAECFKESIWPHLKKDLSCGWEKCTPDILWYLLVCIRIFPSVISSKFLKKHWGSEDLICAENLSHWQRLIKQSTTTHPHVHPVCSEFLDLSIMKKLLSEVWNIIVDENLFESEQNEKAYLGFLLVKEALSKAKKRRTIKSVFSPKLCSILTRSYLNPKHFLHPAANELVSFLCTFVKDCNDAQIQVSILKIFLLQPRAALMEQVLKKKEIALMISYFSLEAVHAFYDVLKNMVFGDVDISADDDEVEDHKRHQAVHQIGLLVSHPSALLDVEWRMRVIEFLFLHAFFTVSDTTEEMPECTMKTSHFPPSLRQAFANSFTKALDSLNRKVDTALSPLQQLLQFLLSVVNYANSLLQKSDTALSPLFPVEKVVEPWMNMKSVVQKLGKQSTKDGKVNESNAFQILFLQLGLQLFQDQERIPDILEELQICCRKALKLRRQQQQEETESDDDEDAPWIQVVVDILLSLLSQPSHHMRCVVSSVFPLVCPFVTAEALQLILDVISPEKDAEENPLIDEENDDEVEFESGSSSNEDKSSDEEGDDEVDEEFKTKLHATLGVARDVSDAESEAMLTDSEMMKLDDALSEAFRSRKKVGHTKLTSEQKTLMHFRIRCLDLISVYLKTEPPMNTVIQIIKPVLAAYESGNHQRQHDALSRKALSILKQIAKIKKFRKCDKVDKRDLCNAIDNMISKAHKETDSAVGNILYSLCIFMVLCERKLKVLQKSTDEQAVRSDQLETLKKYLTALDDFVKRSNSHIIPEMFVTLMNACPEHAWIFLEPLQNYAFDETVRLYRRSQCLGLILSVFKFSKGQKSVTIDMWVQISANLIPKTVRALQSVLSNSDIKPMYTTELLTILVTVASILKEKKSPMIQEYSVELLPLLISMNSSQCRRLTKKGNQSRRQLIYLLGGERPSKRKHEEVEEDGQQNEKLNSSDKKTVNDERSAVESSSDNDNNG